MYIFRITRILLYLLPKSSGYVHLQFLHLPDTHIPIQYSADFLCCRLYPGFIARSSRRSNSFAVRLTLPFADHNSSAFAVDLHIAFDKICLPSGSSAVCLAGSSHDGLDPGLHFQNVKRLCNIIICTIFQVRGSCPYPRPLLSA